MNQPIVTKRIAKEIKLIRYVPERQAYEISILWDQKSEPVVNFLPEYHLAPYTFKRTIKPPIFIKVLDQSSRDQSSKFRIHQKKTSVAKVKHALKNLSPRQRCKSQVFPDQNLKLWTPALTTLPLWKSTASRDT